MKTISFMILKGEPLQAIQQTQRAAEAYQNQFTKILNIGCGIKTSAEPEIINIDWSIYLRLKKIPFLSSFYKLLVNRERRAALENLPETIMVHDLRKGLPFSDNSVDAVYHSHFLEHLDKNDAKTFLIEVKRVLRPGGIHRMAVPDMEMLCKRYLAHVEACEQNPSEMASHDQYIHKIIEQMIRREARGTSIQKQPRRLIENLLLGDARKRGETHQWMYDRFNLSHLLIETGYRDITIEKYNTSRITDWNKYGLDVNSVGEEYKTSSMYVEAVK